MEKIFCIKWATGSINVNANYFIRMTMETIKKLLKLARQNCTEADRQKLLSILADAVENHENAIQTAANLRRQQNELFAAYIKDYDKQQTSTPEKTLERQRKKLETVIQMVEGQEWMP